MCGVDLLFVLLSWDVVYFVSIEGGYVVEYVMSVGGFFVVIGFVVGRNNNVVFFDGFGVGEYYFRLCSVIELYVSN